MARFPDKYRTIIYIGDCFNPISGLIWRNLKLILCFRQLGFPTTLHTLVNLTPVTHKDRCMKMDSFVDKQKELCAKYDKILPVSKPRQTFNASHPLSMSKHWQINSLDKAQYLQKQTRFQLSIRFFFWLSQFEELFKTCVYPPICKAHNQIAHSCAHILYTCQPNKIQHTSICFCLRLKEKQIFVIARLSREGVNKLAFKNHSNHRSSNDPFRSNNGKVLYDFFLDTVLFVSSMLCKMKSCLM